MVLGLVFVGLLIVMAWFYCRTHHSRMLRRAKRMPKVNRAHSRKMTVWVVNEVIRLKALMPRGGCHSIAAVFNVRNAHHGASGR